MDPLRHRVDPNDPIARFFTTLSYDISWDFSATSGLHWYEIIEDGKVIAQIDYGVPLADLIEDLTCWHEGREGTSKSTYGVAAEDGPEFDRLLARVAVAAKIMPPEMLGRGEKKEGVQ